MTHSHVQIFSFLGRQRDQKKQEQVNENVKQKKPTPNQSHVELMMLVQESLNYLLKDLYLE